jgi:hypothetical protein
MAFIILHQTTHAIMLWVINSGTGLDSDGLTEKQEKEGKRVARC